MDRLRLEPQRNAAAPLTGPAPATVDRSSLPDPARATAAFDLAAPRRVALGVFLRHLAAGERVARDAARRQASLAPDRRESRFLAAQSRQEAMHARLFDGFAAALGAPRLALDPCPYAAYGASVGALLDAGHRDEALVATQVVLEALGEVMLARLDAGLARHGDRLRALRRRILMQEASHHRFGADALGARAAGRAIDPAWRDCARRHLVLARAIVESGRPALAHFGLDGTTLMAEVGERLPDWAREAA